MVTDKVRTTIKMTEMIEALLFGLIGLGMFKVSVIDYTKTKYDSKLWRRSSRLETELHRKPIDPG